MVRQTTAQRPPFLGLQMQTTACALGYLSHHFFARIDLKVNVINDFTIIIFYTNHLLFIELCRVFFAKIPSTANVFPLKPR